MTLVPNAVWGSSAWNGWSPMVDLAIAHDGTVWTVDNARFATRWDPVRGAVLARVALGPEDQKSVPTAAALLPDGRHMAVAYASGSLALHDLTTGAPRWSVRGVGAGGQIVPTIVDIDVAFNGATIATAARGETEPSVRFWDTATGAERHRVATSSKMVRVLPDGVHAVLGGDLIVSMATGATVLDIPGTAPVGACTPDGLKLLTGDDKGEVVCWEVAKLRAGVTEPTWKKTNTNAWGDESSITDIAISRDGSRAFTTSTLSHQTWFIANGRRTRNTHFMGTWRIAHAADGARAFGLELQRQRVRHLDLIRHAEIRPSWEHEETITCLAISPDGARLLTGSRDATIQLRDVATGEPRGVIPAGDVAAVAFSADGRAVLHCDSNGGRVHSADTRAELAELAWFKLKMKYFTGVVALPDGSAVFCDEDGTVLCWDLRTNTEKWRKERARAKHLAVHGAQLVVTTTTCELQLWSPATGDKIAAHPIPDRLKTQPQILLDEHSVLAIHTERGLIVRELVTGDQMRLFPGSEAADGVLVRSPDGRLAVTATPAGRVQLWDLQGIRLANELDLAPTYDSAKCAAFTPDSRSFFVGTTRGVILRLPV